MTATIIADIQTIAQSQIQCFSRTSVRMWSGCLSVSSRQDREAEERTWMRMRYVPMAKHNVQTCSVHSTAINMNPSPSHVAVPAANRCPGETSIAFPISPTILLSAPPRYNEEDTYPRTKSLKTKAWTNRVLVVAGLPRYSNQAIDPRIIKAPAIVNDYFEVSIFLIDGNHIRHKSKGRG
jgi:hypothetical protein